MHGFLCLSRRWLKRGLQNFYIFVLPSPFNWLFWCLLLKHHHHNSFNACPSSPHSLKIHFGPIETRALCTCAAPDVMQSPEIIELSILKRHKPTKQLLYPCLKHTAKERVRGEDGWRKKHTFFSRSLSVRRVLVFRFAVSTKWVRFWGVLIEQSGQID